MPACIVFVSEEVQLLPLITDSAGTSKERKTRPTHEKVERPPTESTGTSKGEQTGNSFVANRELHPGSSETQREVTVSIATEKVDTPPLTESQCNDNKGTSDAQMAIPMNSEQERPVGSGRVPKEQDHKTLPEGSPEGWTNYETLPAGNAETRAMESMGQEGEMNFGRFPQVGPPDQKVRQGLWERRGRPPEK